MYSDNITFSCIKYVYYLFIMVYLTALSVAQTM
jgi:hypothetical protein